MSAHPTTPRHAGSGSESKDGDTHRLLGLGAVLILVGLAAVAVREADLALGAWIGEQTWPLMVVTPGLVLLGLAFVPAPPKGLGFAIAGSVVTSVGTILLVQANTDTWESWAYVWALIPGAAGLGMTVYGLLTRAGELVGKGVGLMVTAGVLYIVGWWYFEALFTTGEQPFDIGTWWPLALVGAGAVIAIRALLVARGGSKDPTPSEADEGEAR